MKWRFIDLKVNNAFYNMAVDQAIAESVQKGESLPTIRFYKWRPAAVSLSSYQSEFDVDLELCKKLNIDCVRRITGGRAVYHSGSDFTYSVTMPVKSLEILQYYKEVCGWIINFLKYLGIDSERMNKNDIIVDGKKISGNAAKILGKNTFLQHGTLIYDLDADLTTRLLKIKDNFLVKNKVTSILEQTNVNENAVYNALKKSFLESKDYGVGNLSEKELKHIDELMKEYEILDKGNKTQNRGACYLIWGDS